MVKAFTIKQTSNRRYYFHIFTKALIRAVLGRVQPHRVFQYFSSEGKKRLFHMKFPYSKRCSTDTGMPVCLAWYTSDRMFGKKYHF